MLEYLAILQHSLHIICCTLSYHWLSKKINRSSCLRFSDKIKILSAFEIWRNVERYQNSGHFSTSAAEKRVCSVEQTCRRNLAPIFVLLSHFLLLLSTRLVFKGGDCSSASKPAGPICVQSIQEWWARTSEYSHTSQLSLLPNGKSQSEKQPVSSINARIIPQKRRHFYWLCVSLQHQDH